MRRRTGRRARPAAGRAPRRSRTAGRQRAISGLAGARAVAGLARDPRDREALHRRRRVVDARSRGAWPSRPTTRPPPRTIAESAAPADRRDDRRRRRPERRRRAARQRCAGRRRRRRAVGDAPSRPCTARRWASRERFRAALGQRSGELLLSESRMSATVDEAAHQLEEHCTNLDVSVPPHALRELRDVPRRLNGEAAAALSPDDACPEDNVRSGRPADARRLRGRAMAAHRVGRRLSQRPVADLLVLVADAQRRGRARRRALPRHDRGGVALRARRAVPPRRRGGRGRVAVRLDVVVPADGAGRRPAGRAIRASRRRPGGR